MFAAALLLAHAASAAAATYLFSASGRAGSFYSADQAFNQVSNPPASISPGDLVTISFTLNISGRTADQLFDADPTTNIYHIDVQDLTLRVGSFVAAGPPGNSSFGSLQLWNDRSGTGFGPTDSFSISVLRVIAGTQSPVALGTGIVNVNFGFSGFDFSALARLSDNIAEEPLLTAYGSQSAYFGFLNTGTYLQTVSSIENLQASLVEVMDVPEPCTWLLMTAGYGLVGAMLRTRRLVRPLTPAYAPPRS